MLWRPVLEARIEWHVESVLPRLLLAPSFVLGRRHRPIILRIRVTIVMQLFVGLMRAVEGLTVLVTVGLLSLRVKALGLVLVVLPLRPPLFGLVVLIPVVSVWLVLLASLDETLRLRGKVCVCRHCGLCVVFCRMTFVAKVVVLLTGVLGRVSVVRPLHLGRIVM